MRLKKDTNFSWLDVGVQVRMRNIEYSEGHLIYVWLNDRKKIMQLSAGCTGESDTCIRLILSEANSQNEMRKTKWKGKG